MKKIVVLVSLFASLLCACSVNKGAVKLLAGALTSTGDSTVFTGDDDPRLIAEALPVILKLYESLLAQVPEDPKLNLATGSSFVMYANAFVHTPAKMLPAEQFEQQKEMYARAKKLYLRGRNYVLRGLGIRHPEFAALLEKGSMEEALAGMGTEDVPYLYWSGASWMAAYATDPFDVDLGSTVTRAIALMQRALQIQDGYSDGAIHEFFISYYGAMPEVMGGSQQKAREHFEKALALSKGYKAGPFVSLATTVCIKNQDAKEFRELLEKALAVDIDAKPQYRLANVLAQQEARWSLDHIEDKILNAPEEEN